MSVKCRTWNKAHKQIMAIFGRKWEINPAYYHYLLCYNAYMHLLRFQWFRTHFAELKGTAYFRGNIFASEREKAVFPTITGENFMSLTYYTDAFCNEKLAKMQFSNYFSWKDWRRNSRVSYILRVHVLCTVCNVIIVNDFIRLRARNWVKNTFEL